MFSPEEHTLGMDTSISDVGVTSIGLIRLKKRLQIALHIEDVPTITMLANSMVRSLARTLDVRWL